MFLKNKGESWIYNVLTKMGWGVALYIFKVE